MMKTRSFLLTAGIVLAFSITISCSSDGSVEDGGSSSSTGGKSSSSGGGDYTVYLVDTWSEGRSQEEFSGNGDVIVYLDNYASYVCHGGSSDGDRYCECTSYDGVVISPCKEEDWYDTLLVGKIQNGQISFLPTSIDNKYLDELEPDIGNNEYCQGIYSSDVPKNIFAESFYLYAIIPEKSHCRIRPYLIKSGKANRAAFFYFSEAGKITGTRTCAYPDEETEQINYDMDFSKGWNLAYTRDGYFTTDLSKGGTLEWWLQCEDD